MAIRFDISICAREGALVFCLMKRRKNTERVAVKTAGIKQLLIGKTHHLFGHSSRKITIKTAKHMDWGKLKNSRQVYQPRTEVRANQKNVPKVREGVKATVPNEPYFHNFVTVKAPVVVDETVSKSLWQIIIDKATGIKFSQFHKKKNKIVDDTSVWMKACELVA
jgi:hypothetical protein